MTTQAGLTVILTSLSPVHGVLVRLGHRLSAGDPVQRGDVRRGEPRAPSGILRREYEPLIRKDREHRWMLRTWIFIYVFVGVQMAWVLRPFVGDP